MNDQTQTPSTAPLPSDSSSAKPDTQPDAGTLNVSNTPSAPAGPTNPPTTAPPPTVVVPTNPLASAQPVASPPTPANGTKKKILLVEDDEALASVYTTRLTAEGFDIKHVPNGEEALSGAINFKPDLIILDVMMPRVSGFDVLDIIRNTPETAHVKILMLTALSQEADKQRAESLGVDAYIVKSQVVIADVVDHIKKLLAM